MKSLLNFDKVGIKKNVRRICKAEKKYSNGAGDLSHLRRLRKAISSKANDFIRFIYETGVQEVS